MRAVFVERDLAKAESFFGSTKIEHDPDMPNGHDAVCAASNQSDRAEREHCAVRAWSLQCEAIYSFGVGFYYNQFSRDLKIVFM
jgi:hypothetical protein